MNFFPSIIICIINYYFLAIHLKRNKVMEFLNSLWIHNDG